jgi:hypothetical protein
MEVVEFSLKILWSHLNIESLGENFLQNIFFDKSNDRCFFHVHHHESELKLYRTLGKINFFNLDPRQQCQNVLYLKISLG